MNLFDFSAKTIRGEEVSLEAFKGKTVLVVNTASKCGFTPQYAELEALYKELGPDKFVVLGFPCNQFGGQEPGNSAQIASFCKLNYGVSFPMFEKVKVNGKEAHPLFDWLKERAPGALGTKPIKWNFTKFLVAPDGERVIRCASKDRPQSLEAQIREWLV